MPLPNAEVTSGRVYKILQSENIESLNAGVGGGAGVLARVGGPISVEQLNEDELRRLILVYLARITCQGEWEGLLT